MLRPVLELLPLQGETLKDELEPLHGETLKDEL
jgi:hypothetical protein